MMIVQFVLSLWRMVDCWMLANNLSCRFRVWMV